MNQLQPTVIVSANLGCITHLQSGSETPVRHWVEVLDACISHFGRADALCRWRPV